MHEFLAIQHSNAQIPPRQVKRNRPANDAPADDDDIVCFHVNILSAMRLEGGSSSAGFSLRVFVPAICVRNPQADARAT